MRVRPIPLLLSVALHLSPLLTLITCATQGSPSRPSAAEDDYPQRVIHLLSNTTSSGPTESCDASYIGLGLMRRSSDNAVIELAVNGPAHQAGVTVGDVFINADDFYPGMLEEGAHFRMQLERNGTRFSRLVRVGKVCYS